MAVRPQNAFVETVDRITPRQVVLTTLAVLLVGGAFWLVWAFKFVFFALFTAIFLHVGMKPVVELLAARGVRRSVGVVLVYLLLALVLIGIIVVIAPMLAQQVGAFTDSLPDYYRLTRNFLLQSEIDLFPRLGRLLPPASDMGSVQELLLQSAQSAETDAGSESAWGMVTQASRIVFYAIAIFAMAFYWTLDRERILYALLLRLPLNRRDSVRALIDELESKVGSFLRGQLVLCAAVGFISLVAYLLIGLPYALALGALAFIFEAVPLVGPLLAAIPAVLVAATLGPDKLLWVLLAVSIIQVAENNVLVPRVMDKAVGVNAIVSILAITAFSAIFGILGALLAIPLAAMIQVFINRYLFAQENAALDSLDEGGQDEPGRTRLDLLRLQAGELAQDVRKQKRAADSEAFEEFDAIEDLIEQAADELVHLFANPESADAAPAAAAGPSLVTRDRPAGGVR